MKGFVICSNGMQRFVICELSKILHNKTISHLDVDLETNHFEGFDIYDNCITFKVHSYDDIAKISYLSKSIFKAGLVINEIKLADVKFEGDHKAYLDGSDESVYEKLDLDSHRMATRISSFNSDISANDFQRKIGASISTKYGIEVDLKHPTLPFYGYVDNSTFMLGLDFCAADISKREFKLHNTFNSIKAPFAFAAHLVADIKPSKAKVESIIPRFFI